MRHWLSDGRGFTLADLPLTAATSGIVMAGARVIHVMGSTVKPRPALS